MQRRKPVFVHLSDDFMGLMGPGISVSLYLVFILFSFEVDISFCCGIDLNL